jgi:UDPglucose 6-dehydrogenase
MIGFTGLSHLGIVSGVAAASKGFDVVAHDPDGGLCAALEQGKLPFFEPDLADLLAGTRPRLRFTTDAGELSRCRVIYFSQDVPTDRDNRSDLSAFPRRLEEAARHAAPGAALVVLSQVPPGFTRKTVESLRAAGVGRDLAFHYQVETLIFGRAVERALYPERFIVGCADPAAPLPDEYARLLAAFGCPVLPMRYESAELAKISINLCLVSSVTVANTLAEVCEAVGADWSEIVPALKLDRRIGPHAYLSPGLGIAGGNLERDLLTVRALSREHGTDAAVVDVWLADSRYRRDWALRTLARAVSTRDRLPTVAVWGLAYKPDTTSTKNSPALTLLEALRPFPVRTYDPRVRFDGGHPGFIQVGSALEACRGADALVIMTPWAEFAAVEPAQLGQVMSGRVVIDPYGVLAGRRWEETGFDYFRLGAPCLRRSVA